MHSKMKIRRTSLEILALVFASCLADAGVEKPTYSFCAIETCKCTTKTVSAKEVVDVTCSTFKSVDIHDPSLWKNNQTNQLYPYSSVIFHDNKLINLERTFPASNVVYLDLADNNINAIGDSVFENFQNLTVLILSYNDLEIIHPNAFKGRSLEARFQPLVNLKELRLVHNKLHTLHQNIFEHTTDIEILDLSFNPIVAIDQHTLKAITSLPLLKELYLQYTQIKTLPDSMLHTPRHLEILDLSGNPLETIPTTLEQSQSLTNLYLNNTELVNLTEQNGFPKMSTLKVLHLCQNEFLSLLGKRSLSGISNLEELRICDNIALTEIDSMALAFPISDNGANVWPNVKKLYLQNNKLSYLDSDILARWDVLSELDIRNNPWTCECENQWLIDDLMPILLRINKTIAKQLMCAAPIEMEKFSFYELYHRKSHMRCLDIDGAHPENDALILVGILAGVLIAIPVTLFLILGYQRRWYNICRIFDRPSAAYSRSLQGNSASNYL